MGSRTRICWIEGLAHPDLTCVCSGAYFKCKLRTIETDIKFDKKIDLAEQERYVFCGCPCECQTDRLKLPNRCLNQQQARFILRQIPSEVKSNTLLFPNCAKFHPRLVGQNIDGCTCIQQTTR